MTTFLKTLRNPRVALITLLGCLLSLGIFFLLLKGCSSVEDMSILNHPYISERELKSTEPIEVDPFPEPSLERLVTQLKSELGLTEAEIAVTAERLAGERFIDNLNYMDSRRDADGRQAEWDRRKRLVVAKPELLWTFGFILPPTLDVMELKDNALYDYDPYLKLSKSQEKRMDNLRQQSQDGDITKLERVRGKAAIMAESNLPLTVAKLYFDSGVGQPEGIVGMEYAELAIRDNPDSFEAHHVWALCNRMYYHETDHERVIAGFRQLVERFPNSSIANFGLARELTLPIAPLSPVTALQTQRTEEALVYLKRAIQLDDRIEPNNGLLAMCYYYLGEYEKALAVYQGMSEVHYGHAGGMVTIIYQAQEKVSKLRQQDGE